MAWKDCPCWLNDLHFPCRYLDMIARFARPVPQLCMASILVMDYICTAWGRLLTNLNQPWLSPVNLERFPNAVFEKGAPLSNCIGFVDGTVRPVCRPGTNQRLLYNGHKKVHAIKFQSSGKFIWPSGRKKVRQLHVKPI